MDLLQYAANLNQKGASTLSVNNSLAAFEFFRNALQILVLSVPQCSQILNGCPVVAKVTQSLLMEPHRFYGPMWSDGFVMERDSAADSHIFTKAFVFQPKDDRREFSLQILTNLAAIFFNLGAAAHQRSASMPRHVEEALKVAFELYDAGFELLIHEESCCMDDWSNGISLAILNNMAEVHWTLSDFAKASRVLELQRGLLEIIRSNRRPHNFSEQEMEIFILNTHVLQVPAGAAAA